MIIKQDKLEFQEFESLILCQKKDQLTCELVFFQLNPPLAEEIHLRWMKSLRDEICLTAGYGGGFNFI